MPKATGEGPGAIAGAIGGSFIPGVGPGLGGAIGGSIGSMFGGGQTSRELENYTKSRKLHKLQAQKLKAMYGRAQKQVARGYDRALEATAGIENAERQAILNNQQQQIADMDQRMTSRGLYNTSIGVGGGTEYQGILANTQQSLNDLSSRLASLYSNLYTSRGSEMSGLLQNRFQARQNQVNDRVSFLMGQPITQQAPIDYGGLAKLFESGQGYEPSGIFG